MEIHKIVLLVVLSLHLVLCGDPEVEVSQGTLKGKLRQSRKGRTYSSFTSIPYAKPPIGNLRFKEAVPVDPWKGKLDATKFHAICPQMLFNGVFGTEDCLYLNVYTPKTNNFKDSLLPVVFYIHGGSFVMGSGDNNWYGSEILLDENVVLVTVNYRLGVLGFLTTGDEVVPGNNGLKDQYLALKWVKENIENFGGNPDSITIMGHSSGAVSSHLFAFSPLTRDMINGVISQSCTAFAPWLFLPLEKVVENTKNKAKSLSCPTSDSNKMIKCLQSAELDDIVKPDTEFSIWDPDAIMPFRPVIESIAEGAFLSQHPEDIMKSGDVAKVPFMTGITTEDGAVRTAALLGKAEWTEVLDKKFMEFIPIHLGFHNKQNKESIAKQLKDYYFGNKSLNMDTKSEITDMFTDTTFGVGADIAVRMHMKYVKTPVYYYLFGYRGSTSHNVHFGDPYNDYGVCHADELFYLFNLNTLFPKRVPSEEDDKMSDVLVTLWTNFIKQKSPTEEWKPVNSENMEYYFIKSPSVQEMQEGLNLDRNNFINSLIMWDSSDSAVVKDEL